METITTTTTSPRIYVGTYAKYNNGSIAGAWLDLKDYADREDFYAACAKLHADESDPEFMFQGFGGFLGARSMYCESDAIEALFDWLELDESDRELLAVYTDNVDQNGTIEQAQEAYAGTYDSAADWAEGFLSDTGALESIPETLRYYFDFEAYARDNRCDGMTLADVDGSVWVFHSI